MAARPRLTFMKEVSGMMKNLKATFRRDKEVEEAIELKRKWYEKEEGINFEMNPVKIREWKDFRDPEYWTRQCEEEMREKFARNDNAPLSVAPVDPGRLLDAGAASINDTSPPVAPVDPATLPDAGAPRVTNALPPVALVNNGQSAAEGSDGIDKTSHRAALGDPGLLVDVETAGSRGNGVPGIDVEAGILNVQPGIELNGVMEILDQVNLAPTEVIETEGVGVPPGIPILYILTMAQLKAENEYLKNRIKALEEASSRNVSGGAGDGNPNQAAGIPKDINHLTTLRTTPAHSRPKGRRRKPQVSTYPSAKPVHNQSFHFNKTWRCYHCLLECNSAWSRNSHMKAIHPDMPTKKPKRRVEVKENQNQKEIKGEGR